MNSKQIEQDFLTLPAEESPGSAIDAFEDELPDEQPDLQTSSPAAKKSPRNMPAGSVAAHLYKRGKLVGTFDLYEKLSKDRPDDALIWVGLVNPDEAQIRQACKLLRLKQFLAKRVVQTYRRPKLVAYSNCVHIVSIPTQVNANKLEAQYDELQLIFGKGFLLSVLRTRIDRKDLVKEQFKQEPEMIARGGDFLVADTLDTLVDRYTTLTEKLEKMGHEFEQTFLFEEVSGTEIRRLFKLRQLLLKVNAVIAPMSDIAQKLTVLRTDIIEADSRRYFHVIADRCKRIEEHLMTIRTSLDFAFEASMMIMQTRQNDIVKKLASWAAIAMVPTIIAGIYGMNFEHMPELKWYYGYPLALVLMVVVSYIFYRFFKKSNWL